MAAGRFRGRVRAIKAFQRTPNNPRRFAHALSIIAQTLLCFGAAEHGRSQRSLSGTLNGKLKLCIRTA